MDKAKRGDELKKIFISKGGQTHRKLILFLTVGFVVVAVMGIIAFILLRENPKADFYDDDDGDGIINGNDPDPDGDGIMENFGGSGGGGGSSGGGSSGSTNPSGDIDNDGTPNVNDSDMDGDEIPNGNDPDPGGNETEQIDEQSCENFRLSRNMDESYFSLNFSQTDCYDLATSTCEYGDSFLTNYIWNDHLKCCVWDCTFQP